MPGRFPADDPAGQNNLLELPIGVYCKQRSKLLCFQSLDCWILSGLVGSVNVFCIERELCMKLGGPGDGGASSLLALVPYKERTKAISRILFYLFSL